MIGDNLESGPTAQSGTAFSSADLDPAAALTASCCSDEDDDVAAAVAKAAADDELVTVLDAAWGGSQ